MDLSKWKSIKKQQKITFDELSEKSGIPKRTLEDIFAGRTTDPRVTTVKAIERALGIEEKTPSDKGERKGVWIPVYGRIAAGIPISAIEDIIDEEEISEEMMKHGEYIALQIKGDSMEPRISNGDTVIIRLQETIENGEVAAVFVNGNDVTLKRIKKEDNGIWLIGNNPAFQPIFYSKKQCEELPVRILGKMVELRGKGNF